MYRAIVQSGHNAEDPESTLELISKPIPTAAPGHVVVKITLRPIHPLDLAFIKGSIPKEVPYTPGSDGVGIVESIGEGVSRVKPGQRVMPMTWQITCRDGSWQEFLSLKEELVIPVPDSVSDEAAAQFVINPWTAIGMLQAQDVPKGEYLIITAAGSAIGRQLIQIARHAGVKTIGTVRRPEQKEELLASGADEVICTATEDIVRRVKHITSGRLAYAALDCIGGDTTKAVASSVRSKGQIFVYGAMGSYEVAVGVMDLLRGVSVCGWNSYLEWENWEDLAKEALRLFEAKVIEPLAGGEKFDLADFKEALTKSQSSGCKVFLSSER